MREEKGRVNQEEIPRWEYKVLEVTDHLVQAPAEEALNELGSEGWELTGIDTSFADYPRYVFKRRLAGLELASDVDEEQERWLRNASIAEALLVLPAEKRDKLLQEVLTEEERQCASPPEDFHERVLIYFARKKEEAGT
jgi:hypothetical protein